MHASPSDCLVVISPRRSSGGLEEDRHPEEDSAGKRLVSGMFPGLETWSKREYESESAIPS